MSYVLSLSRPRFIHHLWHHLVVATLITCCVYWASTFGLTGALDSATLYAAQRLVALREPGTAKVAKRTGHTEPPPVILEITPQEYEHIYTNTSPLERQALGSELHSVLKNKSTTKLVVIDLDISPATPDDKSTEVLDALLDSPDRIPVVLAVPTFQGTSALTKRQSEWMKARCEASEHGRPLYFGFPYLSGEGGVILRHSQYYPSLGNVARWAVTRQYTRGSSLLPNSCEATMHPDAICEFHKEAQNLDLLRDHFKHLREQCGTIPIDFGSVASNRLVHAPLRTASAEMAQEQPDNVVFVGGTYDNGDVHLTGGGRLDGVYVHAAIYSSQTTALSHFLAFLLEVALGVGLGFGFSALFRAYANATRAYQSHLQNQSPGAAMAAWTLSLAILALTGVLIIGATALMIGASSSLLRLGSWLNPVPLVIGMLIDGLVASRHVNPVHHHTTARFPDTVWWVSYAGLLACAALITITIAYVFFGASHGH